MNTSRIKRVFGKSGMWSQPLVIFEFEHEAGGMSRSGDFTVSVVIGPTACDPMVMVVLAGHEHTETMTTEQLEEQIEFCKNDDMIEEAGHLTNIRDTVDFLVNQYNNHDYL